MGKLNLGGCGEGEKISCAWALSNDSPSKMLSVDTTCLCYYDDQFPPDGNKCLVLTQ